MSDRDSLWPWLDAGGSAAGVEAEAALSRLRRGMFATTDATVNVGRYRDLKEIGRGGMGVVYRGHDEQSDRSIALKLLRHDTRGQEQRLRREARAMARLSHPNVVQVLEVGTHRGETYVVMELVEGADVAAWLSAKTRRFGEILEVFLAAGEGLVAAHEEGLVHRDFKPSNVMVGDDGRIRVADFGLAVSTGSASGGGDATSGADELSGLGDPVGAHTATGTRVGTPRYMAPEQRDGAMVDARADQWSFAASLWESLYGQHPTGGDDGSREPGQVPSVRARGVPRGIARVLRRSLATDPEDRYGSMGDLLLRLKVAARGPGRRGGLGVAVALVGGTMWWAASASPPQVRCDPAEHSTSLWTEDRRVSIEAAFERTAMPFAAQAFADVDERVGPWVESWNKEYRRVCEVADDDGLNDRTEQWLLCLRAELTEVGGLLEAFEGADRALVGRAEASTRELPVHARCAEPSAGDDIEPGLMAAHAERMARIQAQVRAGRYREAAALAGEALEQTTDPMLRTHVMLSRGLNLRRSGAFEQARSPLLTAFEDGAAAGDATLATRAAKGLLQLAIDRSEHSQAEDWVRHARIWIARIDDPVVRQRQERGLGPFEAELLLAQGHYDEALSELDRVWSAFDHDESGDEVPRVFNLMGMVHIRRGTYDDAARWFHRAATLTSERRGARHPQVASALENLGNTQWYRGDFDAAEEHYREALAIREVALGPDNAKTANTVMNLGLISHVRGDYESAVGRFEEAVESFGRIVGREHPRTAHALANLAATLAEMGQWELSNRHSRESLAIYEAALGPEHPSVGHALQSLAAGLTDVGRYEEALGLHDRALGIIGATEGRSHVESGRVLHNMAVVLRRLHRYDDAETWDREALGIYERSLGPEHVELAPVLVGLADNALATGRWNDAVALSERARAVEPTTAYLRGMAASSLAQARWELTLGRSRTRELVEEARRELTDAGRRGASNLEALETWAAEKRL